MTAQDAVGLITEAMESELKGSVFAPIDPKACNVATFVYTCRNLLAPGIPIRVTGMRPGERLHEPMHLRDGSIVWSNDETRQMQPHEIELLIGCAHARMEAA
jgi:FlaA1/EpsC-like NDP-sugar epimerase